MLIISIFISYVLFIPQQGFVQAQQPTIALATVTGTPEGPTVSVRAQEQDQVNVREGPGTTYPKVGVLLIGQTLAAKGKAVGGDWIQIEYPGVPGGLAWVYAPLVNLSGGELPIIEPPPTPTPMFTPTIDPTLAARFVVTTEPTRLPTFTAPPPLNIPTFQGETQEQMLTGIPMGLLIIILFAGGLFIGLFALAQGR